MDVKKKAEELAAALKTSKEYKRLTAAKDVIEEHLAAKVMLKDFRKKQRELQQQQAQGQEITQSQQEELQKLYEVLAVNPYIRELLEAEFEFAGLIMQVQEILSQTFPVDEEEDEEEEELSEAARKLLQDDTVSSRGKIWTPGS